MPGIKPFTISRVFNAPRELVYQCQVDPARLKHWMGAEGFTSIYVKQDLRVGGKHHYGLKGPDGSEMWGLQTYLEILPNERLVLIQSFSDKDGNLASHPMAPTWPKKMHATISLEDAGPGKTKLTVTWLPYGSDASGDATFDGARAGMEHGWGGTFAKLDAYLLTAQRYGQPLAAGKTEMDFPSATEVRFTRLLEAPRSLVWKAHVTPGMVEKWWGPEGFTTTTHEIKIQTGGVWRYTMHGPDGTDYPNKLAYTEVKPEDYFVADHGDFEKVHFKVRTDLFAEGPERRKLVSVMKFATQVQRDETAKFAEGGHASTMQRLEDLLAAQKG